MALFADAAGGPMIFAIWLTLALTCWFFNVGRLTFIPLRPVGHKRESEYSGE